MAATARRPPAVESLLLAARRDNARAPARARSVGRCFRDGSTLGRRPTQLPSLPALHAALLLCRASLRGHTPVAATARRPPAVESLLLAARRGDARARCSRPLGRPPLSRRLDTRPPPDAVAFASCADAALLLCRASLRSHTPVAATARRPPAVDSLLLAARRCNARAGRWRPLGRPPLSKRLGTLALRDLRKQGIAPQAILSLMARLGSSEPVELRSNIAEVVAGFDLSKFGSAPTKFDAQDLIPLTARHLATLGSSDVADVLTSAGMPDDIKEPFWNVVRDNINNLDEVADWWVLFRKGATPLVEDEDREFVAQAFALLPPLPYTSETWGTWTTAVKEATGRKGKGLFMPLRKAVTGRQRGPEMADVMPLLKTRPTFET